MAKLDWASSFLALRLSAKEEQDASNITDETRNFLHSKKHQYMQEMMELDLSDLSHNNLIQLNTCKSKVVLLEELLIFFASKSGADPEENSL